MPSNKDDEKNVEVPLSQEFLNRKHHVEKATSNLLKKYEVRKSQCSFSNDIMSSQDSEEALSLHLLNFPVKEPDLFNPETKTKTSLHSLNYFERILVNICYTKVQAHSSGFFAENLPHWYKRTFDKDLTMDWLEILEKSNKFTIEKVQNKILLYTREIKEDLLTNMDLNASRDKVNMKQYASKADLAFKTKQRSLNTETSVRYKHLQNSLQGYTKNAGRDLSYADKNDGKSVKSTDKLYKVINKN